MTCIPSIASEVEARRNIALIRPFVLINKHDNYF